MFIFWIVISVVILLVYRHYKDRVFLCLLLGSLIAAISCLVSQSSLVQLGTFACFTLLGIGYIRYVQRSNLFRRLNPIALSDLVGQQAIVLQSIDEQPGQVKLNGDVWHAKSLGSAIYNPGDTVCVVGIKGLFVFVA